MSTRIQENKPMVAEKNTELVNRLVLAIGSEYGAKAKIARACGIEPQSITNWIKRGKIDHAHFPKISEVTGVNLEWLMTGRGEPFGSADRQKSEKQKKAEERISQLSDADLAIVNSFMDSIIAARIATK